MATNSRSKKKKPLTEDERQKREKTVLKRKIRSVFANLGFNYIATNDHHMKIGLRTVEVDALFIFENIWLLCEDTITNPNSKHIKDHIRTKNEAYGEIKNNIQAYIAQLVELFPDKKPILQKYDAENLRIFGLYISRDEISLSEEDVLMFENLVFVQPQTLNYFQWMSQCIKQSARYELFRFLKLKSDDIGLPTSSSEDMKIQVPIIYPKSFTGTHSEVIENNVRVVSFMMSAEQLLNTCYVLRKDSWEESIWLYQRLIDKKKIKSIRAFLEKKGEAFYNNIIVALPDDVAIIDGSKQRKSFEKISNLEPNCQLVLPKEMNSICVIDGQHRIFAHYESGLNNKQEKTIASLRTQLHLLVTGLIFPKDMPKTERARIESEIFLDINTNAKPVQPNVLLHIQKIKAPLSDVSLAQFVIEKLNKEKIFLNMFELSSLENSKIRTASIVKFALRYLVTLTPSSGRKSLFDYWNGDKDMLKRNDTSSLDNYIGFCVNTLSTYFSALKKNFKDDWDNPDSKLLSVISINGFIIALTRQLEANGVKDFEFYDSKFRKLNIDFSKDRFGYTSSQYRKFSSEILRQAFGMDKEIVGE